MPTSYWWRLRLECRWLSVVGGFELGGWDVAEDAVQPAVVVPVDPFHRRVLDVVDRLRGVRPEWTVPADDLGLEQADSRLSQRIIVGVTDAADRRCDTLEGQGLGERDRRILRSGVAMMNESFADLAALVIAAPERHLQCGGHHSRVLYLSGVPADDRPGKAVDHECDVDETRPRAAVGEVGDPFPVRGRRGEGPVEQVGCASAALVGGDRGAVFASSDQPAPALVASGG